MPKKLPRFFLPSPMDTSRPPPTNDSDLPILQPHSLSPSSCGRRSTGADPNSPEFEFWMVRNPSFPTPALVSADELFSGGVLLPLHRLQSHRRDDDPPDPNPPSSSDTPPPTPQNPEPCSNPLADLPTVLDNLSSVALSSSKRWKEIFRKGDRKTSEVSAGDDHGKEKKKERKGGGVNGTTSAELNINLWPFSRSRSAGTDCNRPRMVAGSAAARKVSSAPCSRSNSAGESKSRKWPSSPSRGGVHLGRSSPVWQVRRGGHGGRISEAAARNAGKGAKKDGSDGGRKKASAAAGSKAKGLNLNVPTCIGYRNHLSCRSDENSAIAVATAAAAAAESGGRGGGDGGGAGAGGRGSSNLLNLRSLFTKKVY